MKLFKNNVGRPSNETKKKISNSLTGMFLGEKNPMWHKKVSEETKKKMSIAQSRRKHRNPHTEETKRKISQSRAKYVGEKHPLYGSTFIWITNGVKNKRYGPDNEIPNGWVKGMVQKGKFYKH